MSYLDVRPAALKIFQNFAGIQSLHMWGYVRQHKKALVIAGQKILTWDRLQLSEAWQRLTSNLFCTKKSLRFLRAFGGCTWGRIQPFETWNRSIFDCCCISFAVRQHQHLRAESVRTHVARFESTRTPVASLFPLQFPARCDFPSVRPASTSRKYVTPHAPSA